MESVVFTKNESLWCEDGCHDKLKCSCRVSMLVSTYNLEQLVPLSVRSALAQDYSEYEVVIVDDASSDSSWEKVIETVREYKGFRGVRVKCLRNAENRGIVGTFNRLMNESCGELCVWQCGDDVAHLDRVSKIVRCWDAAKAQHPDLVSVTSDAHRVMQLVAKDFVGKDILPKFTVYSSCEVFDLQVPLLGAAATYSRAQYDFFGPIDPAAKYEDVTMHIRTKLRGSFMIIHEPLLEYRCIGGISTSYKKKTFAAIRKSILQYVHTHRQALKDLMRCQNSMSKDRYALYEDFYKRKLHYMEVLLQMMSDSWRERLAALRQWVEIFRVKRSTISWIVFLLPHRVVDVICWTRNLIGNVGRHIKESMGRT